MTLSEELPPALEMYIPINTFSLQCGLYYALALPACFRAPP